MISRISNGIASYLKKEIPEDTPSIAVMNYSLYIIIHSLFTVVIITIISLSLNVFFETFIGLLFFVALRVFGGGYHLHNSNVCTVLTVIVICASPFIPISITWLIIVNIFNLVLVSIYAPRNFKGYARIPEKYYPVMKLITLLIVGSNFYWMSSTLLMVSLCYSIFLIPSQKGGENK
ncbi:accessory gene regulator ArgB-like protein [Cohnella sp. WQ 127256]|uniref:accessory gene regulator ArgB-like protein n=1 Tax=Cohnella sp. WQ 127256 TaxID=2938790 RepID=UPI00211827C5|nr:accessory gene regulator B family protein [Cohnella sp. WQ 127256]